MGYFCSMCKMNMYKIRIFLSRQSWSTFNCGSDLVPAVSSLHSNSAKMALWRLISLLWVCVLHKSDDRKASEHGGNGGQDATIIWVIKDEFILLGNLDENKRADFAPGFVEEKEERKRRQDGSEKKCIIQMINYGCEPMMMTKRG